MSLLLPYSSPDLPARPCRLPTPPAPPRASPPTRPAPRFIPATRSHLYAHFTAPRVRATVIRSWALSGAVGRCSTSIVCTAEGAYEGRHPATNRSQCRLRGVGRCAGASGPPPGLRRCRRACAAAAGPEPRAACLRSVSGGRRSERPRASASGRVSYCGVVSLGSRGRRQDWRSLDGRLAGYGQSWGADSVTM